MTTEHDEAVRLATEIAQYIADSEPKNQGKWRIVKSPKRIRALRKRGEFAYWSIAHQAWLWERTA